MRGYRLVLFTAFLIAWGTATATEESGFAPSLLITDQKGTREYEIVSLLPDRVEVQSGQFKFSFNRSDIRKAENPEVEKLIVSINSILARLDEDGIESFPFHQRALTSSKTRVEEAIETFGWLIPELEVTLDRVSAALKGIETSLEIHAVKEDPSQGLKVALRSGQPIDATWEEAFERRLEAISAIPFETVRTNFAASVESARAAIGAEIMRTTRHHTQLAAHLFGEMRRGFQEGGLSEEEWTALLSQAENSVRRIPIRTTREEFAATLSAWVETRETGSPIPDLAGLEPIPAAPHPPSPTAEIVADAVPQHSRRAWAGVLFLTSLALGGAAFVLIRAGSRKAPPPAPVVQPLPSDLPQATPQPTKSQREKPGAPKPPPKDLKKVRVEIGPADWGKGGSFGKPSATTAPLLEEFEPQDDAAPPGVEDPASPPPVQAPAETGAPPPREPRRPRETVPVGAPEGLDTWVGDRRIDLSGWNPEEGVEEKENRSDPRKGIHLPGETAVMVFSLGACAALVGEGKDGLRLTVVDGRPGAGNPVASLSLIHERVNDCRLRGKENVIWLAGPEGLTTCGSTGGGLAPLGGFGFRESPLPMETSKAVDPRQRTVWCGDRFLAVPSPNGVLHGVSVGWESQEHRFQERWSHPASTLDRRIDSNVAPIGSEIVGVDESGALIRLNPETGEVDRVELPGVPFGCLGTDGTAATLVLADEGGVARLARVAIRSGEILTSASLPPSEEFEIHTLEDSVMVETPDRLILFENDTLSERWQTPLSEEGGMTHLHFDDAQVSVVLGGRRVSILGRNSGVELWEVKGSDHGFERIAGALVDGDRIAVFGDGEEGGALFRIVE